MLIIISGTPGTGKSTLAKKLAKKFGWYRLDLSQHYKQIAVSYDHKKQCYVADVIKVKKLIEQKTKLHHDIILDSHIAHLLPQRMVDVCIVMTCSNLKKLRQRLQQRRYSKKKVNENVEAEIFQVCLREAEEKQTTVVALDSSKSINSAKLIKQLSVDHRT